MGNTTILPVDIDLELENMADDADMDEVRALHDRIFSRPVSPYWDADEDRDETRYDELIHRMPAGPVRRAYTDEWEARQYDSYAAGVEASEYDERRD